MYNRALCTYVKVCTYKHPRPRPWRQLHSLCSWSGCCWSELKGCTLYHIGPGTREVYLYFGGFCRYKFMYEEVIDLTRLSASCLSFFLDQQTVSVAEWIYISAGPLWQACLKWFIDVAYRLKRPMVWLMSKTEVVNFSNWIVWPNLMTSLSVQLSWPKVTTFFLDSELTRIDDWFLCMVELTRFDG